MRGSISARPEPCIEYWPLKKQVRERRDQLRHPIYVKPKPAATGPRQVWSWDITKLLMEDKGIYLYLYAMLDIYSSYKVG